MSTASRHGATTSSKRDAARAARCARNSHCIVVVIAPPFLIVLEQCTVIRRANGVGLEMPVDEQYRGHAIRISRSSMWHAVLVELDSGTILPTKATALMREGRTVALERAQELVDIYIDGVAARAADAA